MENWRRRITKDNSFRVVRRPGAKAHDQGPVKAIIKTAQPLTPEMETVLLEKLSAFSSEQVEIVNVVDPTLVAGMVVQLGSRLINMSLSAQLNELSRRIERALDRSVQNLMVWDLSAEELQKMARSAQ